MPDSSLFEGRVLVGPALSTGPAAAIPPQPSHSEPSRAEPEPASPDGLQPYLSATPENDTLWVLHRLANDDKHRLPHLVGAAPIGIIAGDRRGRDMAVEMRIGPFDEQTVIGKVIFLNQAETDMEVQTDVRFDIAFPTDCAARGRLIRPELKNLGQRVEEIVRKFESFF